MNFYSLNRLGVPLALRKVIVALCAVLITLNVAHASSLKLFQLDKANAETIQVEMLENPITVDGAISKNEWHDVSAIGELHQVYPNEFEPAAYQSTIKVARDENHLYVLAILYDEDMPGLSHNVMSKGQSIWQDDMFGLVVDPFNSGSNGYFFATNANAFKEEGLISNNNNYLSDWDGIWDVKTAVNQNHWLVEMAIPLSTLSFDSTNDNWRINFFRETRTPEQRLYWTSHGNTISPWAPEHAGTASGMKGGSQGSGLETELSLSVSDKSQGNSVEWEPSLDVNYQLTPSINTYLTFNTDFSATEIDEQQINYSRFSLFTPEKRQFFLEAADIFEFGDIYANGRPFFSRNIGLSTDGDPLPINMGAKITGQTGDTRFGLLSVNQDESVNSSSSNTLSVLRVNHQLSEAITVGAITTHGSPDAISNTLFGTDFQFRNKTWLNGETIEFKGWYQHTDDETVEGNGSAYNFGVYLPNEYLVGKLAYTHIDSRFTPGLGFVNRTNIEQVDGYVGFTSPFELDTLNNLYHNILYDFTESLDKTESSSFVGWDLWESTSKQENYLKVSYNQYREKTAEAFLLVNKIAVPAGDHRFDQWQIQGSTDSSKTVSFNYNLVKGDYYHGKLTQISGGISTSINRHIQASADIDIREMKFVSDREIVRSVSAKLDIALSPDLFWNNWIQYNNVANQISLFSRLVYKPSSLMSFNFVLNQNYLEEEESRFKKQQQEAILKFSYLHRF